MPLEREHECKMVCVFFALVKHSNMREHIAKRANVKHRSNNALACSSEGVCERKRVETNEQTKTKYHKMRKNNSQLRSTCIKWDANKVIPFFSAFCWCAIICCFYYFCWHFETKQEQRKRASKHNILFYFSMHWEQTLRETTFCLSLLVVFHKFIAVLNFFFFEVLCTRVNLMVKLFSVCALFFYTQLPNFK